MINHEDSDDDFNPADTTTLKNLKMRNSVEGDSHFKKHWMYI